MSAPERPSKCGLSDAVSSPLLQPDYLSNNVQLGGESERSAIGCNDFLRHLERVETLRCYWELKHVQLEGLGQV